MRHVKLLTKKPNIAQSSSEILKDFLLDVLDNLIETAFRKDEL